MFQKAFSLLSSKERKLEEKEGIALKREDSEVKPLRKQESNLKD
jgi:hypothetical protein